ncbi:hypothetical protein DNU06_01145 [Putridiphycobacter roseus]|uniref:Uncharacterized protein n=1 Tax=Putridiphycobacter roseus TaxID=2219161 RepID=A0A2W1N1G7_9FLAO|nr:polysaccharide biosynthesis C-terminal domain-containing protein [Putridiphycobacter roseus]PZE18469.1 hypothetical protein DNU06_01145 [Putridiphycobacter roseus]
MGIIKNQTIKSNTFIFIGIGVGAISRFIMPFIFSKEEIGTFALLDSVSAFFAAIFSLGFNQITIQFFPAIKQKQNGYQKYIKIAFKYSLIGIVLGWLFYFLFDDYILGSKQPSDLIHHFSYLIFPLIFFRILFKNLDAIFRMNFKSVLGAFLDSFLIKAVILINLLLFWLKIISFDIYLYIYVLALCIPGLVMVLTSFNDQFKSRHFKHKIFEKSDRPALFSQGLYGIIASASGIIIISIDQLMVNYYLGTGAVGVYSVMFFAGILIAAPARGLKRIVTSVLADSWHKNDLPNIQKVYEKSTVNLLIIGQYLFLVGWACITPVLTFLPQYKEGIYVFFFIGLAQLVEMMTGVNMEIIASSKKYKYNTFFNVALAFLIIIFNYFFIQKWGLPGAAAASALAMGIINIARWYFLKSTYHLQPFKKAFFTALGIGIFYYMIVSFVKVDLNPILKVLVYSILITSTYWFIILKLKLSEDLSHLVSKILKKLSRK